MTHEDGQKIRDLLSIGRQMSHVIYNCHQDDAGLNQLRVKWDVTLNDTASALKELDRLPYAFDPITLGC